MTRKEYIRSNDIRKINILEKADLKKPFSKLNVDVGGFTITQVKKIKLLISNAGAYYGGGEIHLKKKDYELCLNGGLNKKILHELAHNVHNDICISYLKSKDADLNINILDYLFNKYKGRKGLFEKVQWLNNRAFQYTSLPLFCFL